MPTSQSIPSVPTHPSAEQIADTLSVVIWANTLLADEVDDIAASGRRSAWRAVSRLDYLLISVRPVTDARAALARLNGQLLLDGFEIWAARQRAVMQRLAATAPGSL